MRNIHISRAIIAYCLIGIVCAAIAGAIGWQYASTHLGELGAIVFFCIVGAFASVAVYGFAGLTHVWIGYKKVDLQVYQREQLSLPLPSLPDTKIDEEQPEISATVPRKSLPRSRHVLQRLQKQRSPQILQPAKSFANLHHANLQKPFAPGYRPPSNAVANPQPANLQQENMPVADETDAKIVAAAKELRAQNLKVTGIAIANMTGIAQRTVYDRLDKLKDRVMNQ